MSWRFLRFGA